MIWKTDGISFKRSIDLTGKIGNDDSTKYSVRTYVNLSVVHDCQETYW